MNSLVSYDWLKHYVNLKGVTVEEFARRMALSGPAVEKIHPVGEMLNRVVVGHVIEVKKHPNADKLRLATVNLGTTKATIVCGGSNLKKDQWVAVAQVGAKIRWHGVGDWVKLQPAEIRGVKSEGMICAANEIGLADAFPHADREILDLGVALPEIRVKPGTPLADALGLTDDVVMDIEVTSNRVDAMGMVGLAREASAILGKKFFWKPAPVGAGSPRPESGRGNRAPTGVAVTVADRRLCPRYMAVRVSGVTNGPSPWWMKRRLASAGLNSISRLVDITNYVMLEMAQPMHVFDTAKLKMGDKGPEIHVRLARPREKIQALNNKEYELDDKTLVIADAEKPVAIAGVIGGERSSVTDTSADVIFEAATFDPVSVRRTARRLNVYSDSQLRFEKGLSTEALPFALARAVELTLDLCGGHVSSAPTDVRAGKFKAPAYSITTAEVDRKIGVVIPRARQVGILRDLGFKVSVRGRGTIHATVPWWRDHDVESGQDLVEEIARVYGYVNIPPLLPVGQPVSRRMDAELAWEDRLRTIAKGAGLTEIYSYSFTSDDVYRKAGYDPSVCLHVQNPLTSDFAFMRTTLLPSLLQIVAENEERYRVQRLFEVANVYYPPKAVGSRQTAVGWTDLPEEALEMGCAFLVGDEGWREAKGFVEHLFHEFGIEDVSWRRNAEVGFWHPGRSVQAFKDEKLIASVGEVSPAIVQNFKIMGRVAMIDCPLKEVFSMASTTRRYAPPSVFPESKRDLAVVVDARVEYDDIARTISRTDPMIVKVEWFDTFEGEGLPAGKKSVAMHLTFASSERTLKTEDVDAILEKTVLGLREKFKAEIR
ncbi:MAG TPA: phenylalanine--tRNA ligase subunit beta [Candidatus Methylomirabilis sp.]|nr:phenylalanine--tRNA ligase subunit beta [Candidatus Methylomirabilis sp.]